MHCVDCFVALCDSFSLLDLQIAASLLASARLRRLKTQVTRRSVRSGAVGRRSRGTSDAFLVKNTEYMYMYMYNSLLTQRRAAVRARTVMHRTYTSGRTHDPGNWRLPACTLDYYVLPLMLIQTQTLSDNAFSIGENYCHQASERTRGIITGL